MESRFIHKLIDRLDRVDQGSMQTHFLRLAREKGVLETILEAIQEGLIVLDQQGLIQYTNRAALQLLGLRQPECIGRAIQDYLEDIDWERILELDAGEWSRMVSREIEVSYPQHRFLEFYVVPLAAVRSGEQGAVLMLRDVTRERENEAKAIESERLQAITLLAAGVAHEIGNPLNSLTIHLQLLERALRPGVEGLEQREHLADLVRVAGEEVARLDGIITQFLRALRPAAPQTEPTRIQDVLRATLDFMKSEIENRGVWVEFVKAEEIPLVEIDRGQVHQAFFNVLKNALQAMTGGGLLNIGVRVSERQVAVVFADSGSGIEPERLGRIFEAYHTSKEEGSGLGLMIVQRVMRDHGGEIEVQSVADKGTTITLFFPRADRKVRLLHGRRQG